MSTTYMAVARNIVDSDRIYALSFNDPTIYAHITMMQRGKYKSREEMLEGIVLSLFNEKAALRDQLVSILQNNVIKEPRP